MLIAILFAESFDSIHIFKEGVTPGEAEWFCHGHANGGGCYGAGFCAGWAIDTDRLDAPEDVAHQLDELVYEYLISDSYPNAARELLAGLRREQRPQLTRLADLLEQHITVARTGG